MRKKQKRIIVAALLGILVIAAYESNRGVNDATDNVTAANPAIEQATLTAANRRISAYNAHDITKFLAAHAEDVDIFEYPDRKIGDGRDHLEWIFEDQFAQGLGNVKVLGQFVVGNVVVSHEVITIGDKIETLIAVYTIDQNVISSFRLIEAADRPANQ